MPIASSYTVSGVRTFPPILHQTVPNMSIIESRALSYYDYCWHNDLVLAGSRGWMPQICLHHQMGRALQDLGREAEAKELFANSKELSGI